jgi:hypothetical protein
LRWVGDAVVEDDDGAGGEREARAKSRSLTPFAKCASGFGMTAKELAVVVDQLGNASVWEGTGLVAAADGFDDDADERVGGGVGEKDEIDTERVTVSERYRARQTGEGPRNCFGGYLGWGYRGDVE